MDSPLEIIQALGRTAQLTWYLLSNRNLRAQAPSKSKCEIAKGRPRRDRCIKHSSPPPTRPQFQRHFPEEIIIHILEELCVRDIQNVGLVCRLLTSTVRGLLIISLDEAQTCKRLHSISTSLLEQYLNDLSRLGLVLNRDCILPFRIVRSTTTSRATSWASLKPLASTTARVLPFDAANHSLFYITDRGYLCVKERARDRLRLAWKKFKRVPVAHEEPEGEEDNDDANGD